MLGRGEVKYNGNHYFSGDIVIGLVFIENGKTYINDEFTDIYGNEYRTKVEVDPLTVKEIGFDEQRKEYGLLQKI